jgi:hypothetical protein
MHYHEIATDVGATTGFDAPCDLARATNIVGDEPEWRTVPRASKTEASEPKVMATRWRALKQRTQDRIAQHEHAALGGRPDSAGRSGDTWDGPCH